MRLHAKISVMSSKRQRFDLEGNLHLMKIHLSTVIRKLYNCCAKPLLRKAMYYLDRTWISLNLMKTQDFISKKAAQRRKKIIDLFACVFLS